ncbi:hypothetical protein ACWOET_04380 [Enterococcus caccae]|nr:hypothetical protein RU98_GL001557 [Enterococcus caccae]
MKIIRIDIPKEIKKNETELQLLQLACQFNMVIELKELLKKEFQYVLMS